MKVDSKIFRGIEYVQLSELPQSQQEALLQTSSENLFIKILIDGKIVNQCLQYKDYVSWYKRVYEPAVQATREQQPDASPALDIKPNLALNKL